MLGGGIPLVHAMHWVDSRSIKMATRAGTYDKNVSDIVGSSTAGGLRKWITRIGYLPWTKAFQFLDTHTWISAYMKAMDEHGGDDAKAVSIADDTMVQVQGSGAVQDLPAIMRGGEYSQLLTSNMSWWNAFQNMAASSVNKARLGVSHGDYRQAAIAASELFVLGLGADRRSGARSVPPSLARTRTPGATPLPSAR